MILQPARILLIDDDANHLSALVEAIGSLGSAALPFQYKDDHPPAKLFKGVRLVFCDLHLTSDATTTDTKVHCGNIASMLAGGLSEDHGPYLLVIWSAFPNDVDLLAGYLGELAPGQRPFSYVCLDKNAFIDTAKNLPREGADLPGAIAKIVEEQPGLAAMLNWEQMASAAAANVTRSLWNLCIEVDQAAPDEVLRRTLGQLAIGAAGAKFSMERPGESVVEALVPLMADQIEATETNDVLWKAAIDTEAKGKKTSAAQLYSALHFEMPTVFDVAKRGTVTPIDTLVDDMGFADMFGYSKTDILMELGYNKNNDKAAKAAGTLHHWELLEGIEEAASWYLVQINAACDEAQGHPGLLPYCLGVTAPPAFKRRIKRASIETTRELVIDERELLLHLLGRFVIGLPQSKVEGLKPSFRIRTSLLDQLVLAVRTNSARLGVTEPPR